MKQVDATVRKETLYILYWVLGLSALLQAVFLVLGRFDVIEPWNIRMLLGNALSGGVGVLNFFLMGLTVQKALGQDEKRAKNAIKTSQLYRMMLLVVATILGAVFLHLWATIIPLFFPRVAIAFRPLFDRKSNENI
ncbi:MAG: hypothetical protein E7450_03665 [Ruminococcaceae bacterium]|nr:hypothetical protein [Oscillospiraceae bacterium]